MADLTHKILLEIRDEMRGMKREQEKTNERLNETNGRLDAAIDRLDARLDETNQRLGVLAQLTRSIDTRLGKIEDREPDRIFLPQRVESLEHRVAALEAAADD